MEAACTSETSTSSPTSTQSNNLRTESTSVINRRKSPKSVTFKKVFMEVHPVTAEMPAQSPQRAVFLRQLKKQVFYQPRPAGYFITKVSGIIYIQRAS
jgi:hypothetical protein